MTSPSSHLAPPASPPVAPSSSAFHSLWHAHRGAWLILLAEMVGTSMDTLVRFLQQGAGGGLHPFQLMFARTSVICVLSSLYMWWTAVPDFPLGKPGVRGWLVLRSACGFSGLICFYYSVHYLPLAEATIFRFLVPIPTAFACSLLIRGNTFTRQELLAGIVALLGVIIIAQWGEPAKEGQEKQQATRAGEVDAVSPAQRLFALSLSTVGIIGTVGAYTTIRIIGSRAHALISVNYFAVLGMLSSALAMLFLPGVHVVVPSSAQQWIFLLLIGVLGFALQFLLTAGLQLDRSSKATSMMYTQIIFALLCDWGIFGVVPGKWSFVGGGIVIVSTLWAALRKNGEGSGSATRENEDVNREGEVGIVDEERALLGAQLGSEEVVRK